MKKDARDLFGLIDFLHYQPYCDLPTQVWERLVRQHENIFTRIFRTIALRHTKHQIRDDLQLPPQRRVVITVPFTQIEEQHYATMFGQMTRDCSLNLDGTPRTDDWDPDSPTTIEKMRNWLTRLRQTCLHPEVGARNRRALGGKGPLRTVGEVLEVMIDQNDIATRSEERMVRWLDTIILTIVIRVAGCIGTSRERTKLSNSLLLLFKLNMPCYLHVTEDYADFEIQASVVPSPSGPNSGARGAERRSLANLAAYPRRS